MAGSAPCPSMLDGRGPPELLAPAGDWGALRAAVAAGADAVYFGLEELNARRRATNFTRAELPEVVEYLHRRNVKGYVTLNTLVFSGELPRAVEYARCIGAAGADAVIVQDIGLLCLLRRLLPGLPVHASTQMTQTEPRGVGLLRSLGVSRVILARELSLAEIRAVSGAAGLPLEVFVHGALCISYGGQCLASEALWGRSANRGLCGQACRLPYRLIVDGRPRELPEREYLLSAQDLAAHERIAELVALGVAGFKIEGRLKDAAYVGAATGVYRAALDAVLRGEPFAISPEQQENLAYSFSRGFARGFLDGVDHRTLVHGHSPKKRGVLVGRVARKTRRGVVVELAGSTGTAGAPARLEAGDGVVFDDGRPEPDEQGGRVFSVELARPTSTNGAADGGRWVELSFGRGDVDLTAVPVHCRVWKTDDVAVRRRLEASGRRKAVMHRVPLHVRVTAWAGRPLQVCVRDAAGSEVQMSSLQPLAAAEKHPLTERLLREQFGRLGQTPYELATVALDGSAGPGAAQPVMAPKSVLNDLRRQAVEGLLARRRAARHHEPAEPEALPVLRGEIARRWAAECAAGDATTAGSRPVLSVVARTLEQFEAALAWRAPAPLCEPVGIYADLAEQGTCERAVAASRSAARPVLLTTPRVLHPGDDAILERIVAPEPDGVLVRNLGSLRFLRQRRPRLTLVGDAGLNVANEIAADVLLEQGLVRFTPGIDLNWGQIQCLLSWFPPARAEIALHQHVPLFHMRHCVLAAARSDVASCADCGRPCAQHDVCLRDRLGVDHPVLADEAGRSTVFHGAAQSALELVPAMRALGLRHFRVELVREPAGQVAALLDLYAGVLLGELEAGGALRRLRELLPAGVLRGTYGHE